MKTLSLEVHENFEIGAVLRTRTHHQKLQRFANDLLFFRSRRGMNDLLKVSKLRMSREERFSARILGELKPRNLN